MTRVCNELFSDLIQSTDFCNIVEHSDRACYIPSLVANRNRVYIHYARIGNGKLQLLPHHRSGIDRTLHHRPHLAQFRKPANLLLDCPPSRHPEKSLRSRVEQPHQTGPIRHHDSVRHGGQDGLHLVLFLGKLAQVGMKPVSHNIQTDGQFAYLILRFHIDTLLKVAGRHLACHLAHMANGPGNALSHAETDTCSDKACYEQRREDYAARPGCRPLCLVAGSEQLDLADAPAVARQWHLDSERC